MKLSKKQQKKLNEIFAENEIIFAYLFGSQVTGNAVVSSDFDIAVMFVSKVDGKERFKRRLRLMSALSKIFNYKKVDVVVLNDMRDILFKFVISREGVVIYNQDHSAYLNYEVRTMNDYYDFKPFLERYNEVFSKRVLSEN